MASQEEECRAICEREGWEVADVLVDNDRGASRWSGKSRPEYQRLAEVLRQGDVLVTWEASRAGRDLDAYLALRTLCADRGVLWSYSGRTKDLSKGKDRFETGLDALLAEREAEDTRERVLRGKRAAAMSGRPAGRPPYGYRRRIDPSTGKTDGWLVDEHEGQVVKEVVGRTLAGESLWSIVRDFNERSVPAPTTQKNAAGAWRPQRLRVMISSPTYAGLRQHRGEVLVSQGRKVHGEWTALISEDDHDRILAIFSDPARATSTHRGIEPRHLLTGLAVCAECGGTMRFFGPKSLKTPRYICAEGSCVGRRADYVDALVVETLMERLSRRDAAITFASDGHGEAKEHLAEAETLRMRLSEFVDAAARGDVSASSLAGIEARLLPQIEAAEAGARAAIPSPLVASLVGREPRERWAGMTVKDRRTVVASLMDITILRSSVGTRRFSPDDVEIAWRTD